MYKIKVSEKQKKENCKDEFTSATYINGIIEIIFISSIVVSIKYPVALYVSLIVAVAAIVINTRLLKLKK